MSLPTASHLHDTGMVTKVNSPPLPHSNEETMAFCRLQVPHTCTRFVRRSSNWLHNAHTCMLLYQT